MKYLKGIRRASSKPGRCQAKYIHLAGDLKLVRLSIIFIGLTKEAITDANIALENVPPHMDNFSIRV